MKLIICASFLIFLQLTSSAENSINVNVKNVINVISDKFLSFSVDFMNLLEIIGKDPIKSEILKGVGPAYVKLENFERFVKNYEKSYKEFNNTDILDIFATFM